MKILCYQFFPGGGIGRYTHELLSHMQLRGDVEVELVCLPAYEWKRASTYPVWTGLQGISHRLPMIRRVKFLAAQGVNPRRLIQRAAETGADVVHFSNINHLTFPLWRRGLDRTSVKVAATVHDVRRAKAMINRRYEEHQLKSFYRRADALFVHSQAQAEDLVEYAQVEPCCVHIVPHGPYEVGAPSASQIELRIRHGLPQRRQIALFFGQVRDEKNLQLLIRALVPYRDRVHLLVAGSSAGGQHKGIEHYRNLTDQLGLSESVTFRSGYVPEGEVADLFEICDWVALPYSRSFTSQSGVLNVAAAARRPVLASGAGTFEETVSGARVGQLVEPDDEGALGSGIASMLEAVESGSSFEFGDYLRMSSWDVNVERTIAVYRQLLGGEECVDGVSVFEDAA